MAKKQLLKREEPRIGRREFLKGSGAALALGAMASLIPGSELKLPGNRRLKVFFHFGPHGSAKLAEHEVLPLIDKVKPHIVGIETVGDEESLRYLETTRDQPALNLLLDPYRNRVATHAKEHGIKIYSVERYADEEEKRNTKINRAGYKKERDLAMNELEKGNIEEAITAYMRHMHRKAYYHLEREKKIKRRLSSLYSEVVKRYPDLKKKQEIRMLIAYGALHTTLYPHAQRVGFGSIERSTHTPTYFTLAEARTRRKTFGLPDKILSEEEAARALLGETLVADLKGMGYANNRNAYANIISRKLTLDQIKSILAAHRLGSPVFRASLEQNGISLPSTREELRAFLARRLGEKRVT